LQYQNLLSAIIIAAKRDKRYKGTNHCPGAGMSKHLIALAALAMAGTIHAKPPREQSPAPRDILAEVGAGNTDAELQRAIAAAAAHPLGSAENPIRVAGPEGAQAYLTRLKCADGSAPRIGAKGQGGIGAYGSILDLYPVDCGAAAPGRLDLRVDIYHEENVESRAPAGFRPG
jgi:hypothetical protein